MSDFDKQVIDIDRCIEQMKEESSKRLFDHAVDVILQDNIPESYNDMKITKTIPVKIPEVVSKRKDVISWDECFMRLAATVSERSKDPSTQVGACIIETNTNRVVSLGYNGFPFGCSDDEFPWDKKDGDNKYLYVVHAEMNAILSAKKDLSDHTIYVTYFPCNECMKAIIQSGIKNIVYMHDYRAGEYTSIASLKMARAAGITLRKYELDQR